jgi:hypothetical protein
MDRRGSRLLPGGLGTSERIAREGFRRHISLIRTHVSYSRLRGDTGPSVSSSKPRPDGQRQKLAAACGVDAERQHISGMLGADFWQIFGARARACRTAPSSCRLLRHRAPIWRFLLAGWLQ